MRIFFGMETLLRERSGGHTGTAPTVSFGQIGRGWFCLLGKRCTRTNTIGVVLLPAQGCRRQEATLGKVVGGTYAIGIVLFKINFRMKKSFANNPFAAV